MAYRSSLPTDNLEFQERITLTVKADATVVVSAFYSLFAYREQILPFSTVYSNLKAVGAPYEPEMIYVSRAHLVQTLSVIPYMRNRFASIDVLHRLGYMDEFRESLFGEGARWEVKTFSSRVL